MRTRSNAAFLGAVAGALAASVAARAQDGVAPPGGAPFPGVIYPDGDLPLPEGFTYTRTFARAAGVDARSAPDSRAANLPREIPDRLAACWTPPFVGKESDAQITVRVSFTKNGSVIGTPATPFLQATDDAGRRALRSSLLEAIRSCSPLRFTASLGRAIAGRIFAIRFIVHPTSDARPT